MACTACTPSGALEGRVRRAWLKQLPAKRAVDIAELGGAVPARSVGVRNGVGDAAGLRTGAQQLRCHHHFGVVGRRLQAELVEQVFAVVQVLGVAHEGHGHHPAVEAHQHAFLDFPASALLVDQIVHLVQLAVALQIGIQRQRHRRQVDR